VDRRPLRLDQCLLDKPMMLRHGWKFVEWGGKCVEERLVIIISLGVSDAMWRSRNTKRGDRRAQRNDKPKPFVDCSQKSTRSGTQLSRDKLRFSSPKIYCG
jgi:hypothetical protein